MTLDKHLNSAWWALRIGLGLAAFLAGLDKFFNLLTNWTTYLNPLLISTVARWPLACKGGRLPIQGWRASQRPGEGPPAAAGGGSPRP